MPGNYLHITGFFQDFALTLIPSIVFLLIVVLYHYLIHLQECITHLKKLLVLVVYADIWVYLNLILKKIEEIPKINKNPIKKRIKKIQKKNWLMVQLELVKT